MGKPTGFIEVEREVPKKRDIQERLHDYKEVEGSVDGVLTARQAARCMDCGVPFCHSGCPLGNNIPEFNDAAYHGNWKQAYDILVSTNNFPEFTGRICPAPCESSCVLAINKPAVAIEYIEKSIIEKAFELGLVVPKIPVLRTGKKVAVIGSGPSGLATAVQLNSAGHLVTVFESSDEVGGLLRYGIPDFKLDKGVLERRVNILKEEGIIFKTKSNIGENVKVEQLQEEFDAIVLCGGSTVPRDLQIPGRNLKGIHFAMDFLTQQNRRVSSKKVLVEDIFVTGKNVMVIGGGDTGSDCVGTSNRHEAKSVSQIEILNRPPDSRHESTPWPNWPMVLRSSTSHEEGCERQWAIVTKEFIGDDAGNLKAIKVVEVEWVKVDPDKPLHLKEITGTEKTVPCELALLALGFLHPQKNGLLNQLGVDYDERGNVLAHNYKTSVDTIFSAGDMRRGQSLVVWAISEGREAARVVDEFLMGVTSLPAKGKGVMDLV